MSIPLQLTYVLDKGQQVEASDAAAPICFCIPNRAKELPCCRQNIICSLCARSWFGKHRSCPFCRTQLSSQVRHFGVPDSPAQKIVDSLIVACPFSLASCPWVGNANFCLTISKTNALFQKVVPHQAGIPPISDFARQLSITVGVQAIPTSARSSMFFNRRLSAVGSTTGLVPQREENEAGQEAERQRERAVREGNNQTPLWEQVQEYVMTPEQSAERAQRRLRSPNQIEEGSSSDNPWYMRNNWLLAVAIIVFILVLVGVGMVFKARM
ncbi:hypothetical protein BDR26DRAFT_865050 [Obelidium mucronatum]|nr:hypothetical protein BDR26DRAFT_865050 [Obelidium mucronatum]